MFLKFFQYLSNLNKFSKHKKDLSIINSLVKKINLLEAKLETLTDEQLKQLTPIFKQKLKNKEVSINDLLPEAFAAVREASKRTLKLRHYDVQLMAGIILHWGSIAEMKTGEGKTLSATLAAYLNALAGKVHIISMNDYLTTRDSQWMKPVFEALGMTVGCVNSTVPYYNRKEEYQKDITYATNNERAFDYLRDNMQTSIEAMSSYDCFDYCIIDEVDSILIDEARTPLIISGENENSDAELYKRIMKIVEKLKINDDYEMDEKLRAISLTETGQINIEALLKSNNFLAKDEDLYDINNAYLLNVITQCLKALIFFQNGIHYMIVNNGVAIVDEFTGRVDESRRYSDGLHQALEAKEGLNINPENKTLASISYQNFFLMYKKISGMTGTAMTEAKEFHEIYNMNVIAIPTNKPAIRNDKNDLIYMSKDVKFNAIIEEIANIHKTNQPILIGTISIEKSEYLSAKLRKLGIKHNVLNAKNHEKEAAIIAEAGRFGAVTIATNMAGRGTDIMLGGNLNAKLELTATEEEKQKITLEHEQEKQNVINTGGLYVIGTERHENRRIDNQLIGRSGRQGDPGASQFFLSLDDDLLRIFGGERMSLIMARLNNSANQDLPMQHKLLDSAINRAQKRVEQFHSANRKHVLQYDQDLNHQRSIIYRQRIDIIKSEDILAIIMQMIEDLNDEIYNKNNHYSQDDILFLVHKIYDIDVNPENINERIFIEKTIKHKLNAKFNAPLNSELGALLKDVLIITLDQEWSNYVNKVEDIKEQTQLSVYANKDPLIEFKTQIYKDFDTLFKNFIHNALEMIFHIKITNQPSMQPNISDIVIDSMMQ